MRTSLAEIEQLLGYLHLGDAAHLGVRERKKAGEVHALLAHLEPLLKDASRKRELCVVDAAAGRGHVAAALAQLLLPEVDLRARIVACEWDKGRVERVIERFAECGLTAVDAVASPISDLSFDDPPDLIVALHACGAASDDVIDLAIRSQAQRLALVPCCHPRRSDLLQRLGIAVGGTASDRLVSAVTDALRVLRLEASGYRVATTPLAGAATTGRDLVITARTGGGQVRSREARKALDTWGI